ncbi:MAG: DciA family protein [Candidatus Kerfeldbacteria bacterium]
MFKKLDDSFLQKSVRRAGIGKQVEAAFFVGIVQDVLCERFGEGACKHARAKFVKDRALGIEIKHPAVGEEIRRQEESIISAVNEKIGRPEIVRIFFTLPKNDPDEPLGMV